VAPSALRGAAAALEGYSSEESTAERLRALPRLVLTLVLAVEEAPAAAAASAAAASVPGLMSAAYGMIFVPAAREKGETPHCTTLSEAPA
jgi:hypothetical protein